MVKNFQFKQNYNIDDLIEIVKILRSPGGCPWDAEQTHESIKLDLLEEAYETVDAINCKDPQMMCEELGDVLLQVVFHARVSKENGGFNLDDVADGVCKKLIYRHPHVFGSVEVSSSDEVLDNWDNLKKKEKSQTTATDTLKSVPVAFPALMRAQKVQKRASKAGMDFSSVSDAFSKIAEEIEELKSAQKNNSNIFEEAGDLLFSCVNVIRLLGLDAEESLAASTEKFISRFSKAEELSLKDGKQIADLSESEQNKLWDRVK